MQDRVLEPRPIYIVGFASSTIILLVTAGQVKQQLLAHTSVPPFFQSSGTSPSAATMHVCTLAICIAPKNASLPNFLESL